MSGRRCVMCTSLDRHNPNSLFQLCFLHVQPSWSLSGYCHHQGQAISADTLMAFLFRFDIPCYLSGGLTCDLIWLQVLISGNDPNPSRNEREKNSQGNNLFGFCTQCIFGLHLGFAFGEVFCFLCRVNKILTKLTRRTKCFTFFF